nr:MBL fold metallo-hydrolase [candidate division Zixibacteria bacterium]
MKNILFVLCIILILITPEVRPQHEAAEPATEVTRLNDNLFRITCIGAFRINVTALTGNEGILLVESGLRNTTEVLKESLAKISDGEVKYIINTHMHADHTGGNRNFPDDIIIVAHDKARLRIGGQFYHLPPYLTEGLPEITFSDTMTIYFNDQTLKLIYFPDNHTDGDIIVYLPDYKTICMGDLFFAEGFPYIDITSGGNVVNYTRTIDRIAAMMPDDAIYIPGHGGNFTKNELLQYNDTLKESIRVIRSEMARGRTAEQMIVDSVLSRWSDWNKYPFVSNDQWLQTVYESLHRDATPGYTSICDPVSRALVEKGIDEAVRVYRYLSRNYPGRYDFEENQLNILGYQLLRRGMIDEAIAVFELNIEAYPESANVYDSMGEAFLAKGDTTRAIENYEKSLELNPENENAVQLLEQIQGE